MKRLMICIALMSSASAFAGPVQEGTMLLIAGKAQVAKNKIDIALARNSLSNIASDLKKLEVKSPELKKINTTCADTMLARADKQSVHLEGSYVSDVSNRLSRQYDILLESASKLEKAQKCADCDAEIREETIAKYQEKVNSALYAMKNDTVSLPANTVAVASGLRICDYSGLFSFEDSKKFTDLKDWNYGNYSANLSPTEILSGEYNDTLELIVRKSRVKVKRSASRFGSESSQYKNGVVNIQISYDDSIITGVDNVRHPEVTNVVDIIHRDR